jgi:hypothetical protein
MEKEGANLADRLRSIAVQETFSGGMRIVLEGSGEKLRRLRRYTSCLYQMRSVRLNVKQGLACRFATQGCGELRAHPDQECEKSGSRYSK